MDVLTDVTFWSDVGLTTAVRLSLVALVLWAVKSLMPAYRPALSASSTGPKRDPKPVTVDLKERVGRVTPQVELEGPRNRMTTAASQNTGERELMRQQLLQYLEKRSSGRPSR